MRPRLVGLAIATSGLTLIIGGISLIEADIQRNRPAGTVRFTPQPTPWPSYRPPTERAPRSLP